MPIILIGALGGMAAAGIGMFVGAALPALGYQIFMGWVAAGQAEASSRSKTNRRDRDVREVSLWAPPPWDAAYPILYGNLRKLTPSLTVCHWPLAAQRSTGAPRPIAVCRAWEGGRS
jgi:hypothetical protein